MCRIELILKLFKNIYRLRFILYHFNYSFALCFVLSGASCHNCSHCQNSRKENSTYLMLSHLFLPSLQLFTAIWQFRFRPVISV